MAEKNSFYDIKVTTINGEQITLEKYRNCKLILVTNVASKCGNTKRDQGLEILAFPCNQFSSQESKPEADIKQFVKDSFDVEFPMFSKVHVNGPNTHQIFSYLKKNSKLQDHKKNEPDNIPWNFGKFLVRQNGQVIDFYTQKTKPLELEGLIKKELEIVEDPNQKISEKNTKNNQHDISETAVQQQNQKIVKKKIKVETQKQHKKTQTKDNKEESKEKHQNEENKQEIKNDSKSVKEENKVKVKEKEKEVKQKSKRKTQNTQTKQLKRKENPISAEEFKKISNNINDITQNKRVKTIKEQIKKQ